MTQFDPIAIRKSVVERYGTRARRAMSVTDSIEILNASAEACCDDNCCGPSVVSDEEISFVKGLYADDEVTGLPEGALEAAAGCGNPTAIAELRLGETVLDLGSGGGIDCFLASRQVGPQGTVIGVDMTPDMLDLARQNAVKIGATNVQFKLGEIEDLPLPDASVDVIISNCVVNLSTNKPQVLRESARVLKPGGRLRISDMVWLGEQPADAEGLESWSGCIAGALPLEEFLSLLSEAGFVNGRAEPRRLEEGKPLASALIYAEKP